MKNARRNTCTVARYAMPVRVNQAYWSILVKIKLTLTLTLTLTDTEGAVLALMQKFGKDRLLQLT